eukprot:15365979-Ditylum_brightwellii.AAC.1
MSIPNSARSIRYNMRHSSRSSQTSSSSSSTEKKKCALLFFGLIKDSYESISLPSIQKHILQKNDQCDIFLHTYNLTTVPLNRKNGELTAQTVNVSKGAYLLTHHVILDNMDTFYIQRNKTLEHGAVPGFASHNGYNDRMFYGLYDNAKIWASERFNFVDVFEKTYMKPCQYSEYDWFTKDHCLWRVRSGGDILAGDCNGMAGFSSFREVQSYLPAKIDESSDTSWSVACHASWHCGDT